VPVDPLQKALEDWGAAVGGKWRPVSRRCFRPAVGKAFDHYEWRATDRDVTYINPLSRPLPVIGAGELPFLMSDAKAARWARRLVPQYAREGMKDVNFCLAFIIRLLVPRAAKKVVVPTTSRA